MREKTAEILKQLRAGVRFTMEYLDMTDPTVIQEILDELRRQDLMAEIPYYHREAIVTHICQLYLEYTGLEAYAE